MPLILAAMIVARNPAQYGMDIEPPPVEAPNFEKVTLPVAVDLRRVAEWAGTSVQTIQDLNPELRRWTTPVRTKDYELKVPRGSAEAVRAARRSSSQDAADLTWHTVRKGETLLSIARKLKVSRADLADANYLSAKSRVTPGQQLIVPRAPTLLLAARTDNPGPARRDAPSGCVVTASTTVPKSGARGIRATVENGLPREAWRHAVFHRARVPDERGSLKKWNSLGTNSLRVGQRLTILTTAGAIATH